MASDALEFYKGQVQEWLKKGIVEPFDDLVSTSQGKFNTNAFPVYSGKMRIVHNFKLLNAFKCDTAYVPGINEVFNVISRNPVIFSRLIWKAPILRYTNSVGKATNCFYMRW